ncbi:MAG: DUF6483 family protein [Acutalibacteraceae bacterium]|nr:DUF6483 family protein [Acutalibacteraceae bacterium]
MFQNDWMMRQVEELGRFLAKLFFHKETTIYEVITDENGNITDEGLLYLELKTLLRQGKLNQAENLLFERIGHGENLEYLEIAIDFYSQLNDLTDEYLEEHGFSREEVKEGLMEVRTLYGIADI